MRVFTFAALFFGIISLGFSIYQGRKTASLANDIEKLSRKISDDPEKISRIEKLEKRMRYLEKSLQQLVKLGISRKDNSDRSSSPVLSDSAEELKNLRKDIDAVLTDEALNTEEGQKRLKEILKKSRDSSRVERRKRFDKLFNYMLQERLKKLGEENSIPSDTLEKIDSSLSSERTSFRDLRKNFRAGEIEPSEFFRKTREMREKTNNSVKGMLSDEQYKAYMEMRDTMGGRGRMR
ncbi:MAG: hypothetical protein JXR95_01235 [Deltaproteobacteria bacterium]|nr:hypothetical protein [Deltaproteobacteria bacterium]